MGSIDENKPPINKIVPFIEETPEDNKEKGVGEPINQRWEDDKSLLLLLLLLNK